jgi:hypothetical protein
MTTMGWPGSREEEYLQALSEPVQVDGFDSIEAWAASQQLTLSEALEEGVRQDDDGTIWVPVNLSRWLA